MEGRAGHARLEWGATNNPAQAFLGAHFLQGEHAACRTPRVHNPSPQPPQVPTSLAHLGMRSWPRALCSSPVITASMSRPAAQGERGGRVFGIPFGQQGLQGSAGCTTCMRQFWQ